jgi:hypothetical protein
MGADGDGHRDPTEFHDQTIEDTSIGKEQATGSGKSTSGLDKRAPNGEQQAGNRPRRLPIQSITVLDQRLSHIFATFERQTAGDASQLFEAEAISLRWVAWLAEDDS